MLNVVLCIQVEGSLAAVWFTGGERTRCSGKAAAAAAQKQGGEDVLAGPSLRRRPSRTDSAYLT